MEHPKNWPDSVTFITTNVLSTKLTAIEKSQILAVGARPLKQKVSKNVKIKRISDSSHPAHGQFGLFADRKFAPKEHIIDYLGYVHPDSESDENSNYDLLLCKESGIGIDATRMGCEARMINDYRGVLQRPNVQFDERWVNGELRMGVFVLNQPIRKGQELCVSYGKGFWDNH